MMKKYFNYIPILILLGTLFFTLTYPKAMPILGMITLLFSLALTLYGAFEKHKETENSRIKITKGILILIFTFLLISFLGGVAGLFTNFYMSNLFGAMAGLLGAILIGFTVGYLVRKGISKLEA